MQNNLRGYCGTACGRLTINTVPLKYSTRNDTRDGNIIELTSTGHLSIYLFRNLSKIPCYVKKKLIFSLKNKLWSKTLCVYLCMHRTPARRKSNG